MDEKRKEQQRDRYRQTLRHEVGHEEQKRRRSESTRRKAERAPSKRRRQAWDEDGGDSFEKIRRSKRHRKPATAAADLTGLPTAVVAAVHHGRVDLDSGETARIAGHLLVDPEFRLVVGDDVAWQTHHDQARVEGRLPRRTVLGRPDPGNPNRQSIIAANVDVAVIVMAAKEPAPRPGLIDRLLLALADSGIKPLICMNKLDLLNATEVIALNSLLTPYRDLGYPVLQVSAADTTGIEELQQHLSDHTCVFVGHSGVGKSSLLNAIDPDGDRATGETRDHDGKGRHTTTWSSLRQLGATTRIIDTPGVRSFGLDQLTPEQLRAGFADFAPFAGRCRFADCSHRKEPACAVRQAAEVGALSPTRYASYLRILDG